MGPLTRLTIRVMAPSHVTDRLVGNSDRYKTSIAAVITSNVNIYRAYPYAPIGASFPLSPGGSELSSLLL